MTRYDAERLHLLITRHARFTGSARAAEILADWKTYAGVPQGDAGRIAARWPRWKRRGPCRRPNNAWARSPVFSSSSATTATMNRSKRVKHWREFVLPLPEEDNREQAARCMDCGILLPHRLSGEQPDPGLERPGLPRQLAGGRAQPAHDQQFPRSSPAASVPRRARPPARSTSTTIRSPSRRSNARSSTAPSSRAG